MRPARPPLVLVLALLLALTAFAGQPALKDLTVAEAVAPDFFGTAPPRNFAWLPDGSALLFYQPPPKGGAGAIVACSADAGSKSVALTEAALQEALARREVTQTPHLDRFGLSPSGRYLLVPTDSGALVWDRAAKTLAAVLPDLGESPDLAWSPDESRLAYSSGGDLWVVARDSGARQRVAQGKAPLVSCGEPDWLYEEELDLDRAFWWSPDGKALAYFRFDETGVPARPLVDEAELNPEVKPQFYPKPGDKNPRVTLEVVRLEGAQASGPILVAESGEGYLARATWLPSSEALAYQILDRVQEKLALVQYDLRAGTRRALLEETSSTWVNVLDEPRFFSRRPGFLWRSERDGFAHLYSCPQDGAQAVQLTRGAWVVDEVLGVDEKRGFVYFSGNREDPIGKQVYRVDLKGRALARLTDEPGWHEAQFSPSFGRYLDTRSRAGTPSTLHLVETATRKSRPVADAPSPQLQEYGFSKPEFFTFGGPGGQTLDAVLYRPRDFDPGRRYPVVVEVYGGPWAQVVQDRWSRRDAPLTQLFAQAGFVYVSVDGRGSGRRGRDFEGALCRQLGQVELEDQLAGLEALKKLPFVDAERVGIWGWSYGGFMVLYALTHSGAFRCGAAVAPPADWLSYDSCYTERYLKLPADNAGGYRDSSPVHAAAALSAPLLLAHGLVDDNVHFYNSARMAEALTAAHKPFEMAFYPRKSHGIAGEGARADLFSRILGFFEKHLKGSAGAAS